jgi:hypothetical protein
MNASLLAGCHTLGIRLVDIIDSLIRQGQHPCSLAGTYVKELTQLAQGTSD